MKKIALALAAVLLASSPVLALDFSSTLVYPPQAAPAVRQTAAKPNPSGLDYRATHSIRNADKPTPARKHRAAKAGTKSTSGNPPIVPNFR